MSSRKYSDAQKAAYYAKRARVGKPKKKYSKSKSYSMISGSGDYTYARPGPFGRVGRAVGKVIGGIGGGLVGAPYGPGSAIVLGKAGSAVGGELGGLAHYIGKIFGSGDYKTGVMPSSNVLTNTRQIPQFSTSKMTNVVCHREYLQDVISSATPGAFKIQSFDINAGLSGSFPWLAQVAANYEQFKIHGMVFEFRTMSADALNSTNTALGQVIMAVEYNSANPNFVNKQQMENYEYAVSCKPSDSMLCAVECARGQTPVIELYVRTGAVPTNQDQRLYDLGNFQIATNGLQAASVNVGELWVTFCVELLKPRLYSGPLGYNIPTLHRQLTSSVTTSDYFNSISTPLDTIGLTVGLTTLTFPAAILAGTYLIQWSMIGSSTASVQCPTFAATTNCVGVAIYNNNSGLTVRQPVAPTTTNTVNCVACFSITGPSAVITLSGGTMPGSLLYGDLVVSQCSALLVA
nr:putative capsid protein [Crucivirus sp.]